MANSGSRMGKRIQHLADMPVVTGVLDGFHITMKAPEAILSDYPDRIMKNSEHLMAVCAADKNSLIYRQDS